MTAVRYSRATLITVFSVPDGIGIPARAISRNPNAA
jgi:hypothetical protein